MTSQTSEIAYNYEASAKGSLLTGELECPQNCTAVEHREVMIIDAAGDRTQASKV